MFFETGLSLAMFLFFQITYLYVLIAHTIIIFIGSFSHSNKPSRLGTAPEAFYLINTLIKVHKSYYKSSSVCLFVCLSVCLFVPYLLRGPLTDLRQTWWVYVGGPRNCPWGVLFRKGQRLDGSTGHFHFPLYYICASLTPHSCKRRLCCYCI